MQDAPEIAGNAQQLQEFVAHLTASQGRIRGFIVTLMPGSPDVGDVLQETNLTLWKSRARYRPGTNFLAWAFTVARLEVPTIAPAPSAAGASRFPTSCWTCWTMNCPTPATTTPT